MFHVWCLINSVQLGMSMGRNVKAYDGALSCAVSPSTSDWRHHMSTNSKWPSCNQTWRAGKTHQFIVWWLFSANLKTSHGLGSDLPPSQPCVGWPEDGMLWHAMVCGTASSPFPHAQVYREHWRGRNATLPLDARGRSGCGMQHNGHHCLKPDLNNRFPSRFRCFESRHLS